MDPYAQFHQDHGVLIHSNGTESQMDRDIENLIVMNNVDRPKKKARGPTQMRSVWGRRESEGPLHLSCNQFGQTTDEIGQGLSSFMGSMIRDGKIAALDYESWHKVPGDVKETLWTLAKSKYDLDDSSKKWVMQKFGKQLNSWRNRVTKNCFKGKEDLPLHELQKHKDSRVFDSQFEKLVKHWSSEKSKEMSRRNKIARSHRIHNHTTGTKSFARVAKEQEKALGRPPNRAEMFKYVMTSKNETQPPDDISSILNIANRVDLEFPSTNTSTGANTSTSADCNLQVGTKVFLKSILDA